MHNVNPYGPQFANGTDIAITWLIAAAWFVIVGAILRRRFVTVSIQSERVCSATASACFAMAVAIMGVFGVGLVFLVWLKVTTVLWYFWLPFYLVGIGCVFWVLPIVAISLVCWAMVGQWKIGFSSCCLKLALACLPALLIDAMLYFWLCYGFAKTGG
jgi:hypothetical protein